MTVPEPLLQGLLAVVTTVLGGTALFLLGHGVWLGLYRRKSSERLAEGRRVLQAVVLQQEDPDSLKTLRRLPVSQRARLVVELSRNLSGEARQELSGVAEEVGVVEAAEQRLDSHRWWRRLGAARTLQAVGAADDVIPRLLGDPHPAVRAQAAEWAGDRRDPELARALLRTLNDPDAFARFAVQDALLRLGSSAVEPLTRFLSETDGPEVVPALEVAAALAQPPFVAPAIRLCDSSDPQVRELAADLLGAVGGSEGTGVLVELLADPEPGVRAAAAGALGRIGHWPAATSLSRLLRDRSWQVRQAAGLALRSLGGPGEILLRNALNDPDRFAADAARQIMDLPAGVRSAW